MQHLPEPDEQSWIVDGLGDLEVRLEPFEPDDSDERHTAAYFQGIEKGVATFGLNVEQVADLEPIAGVLAHEVAHAYRHRRGLRVDDPDEEELFTDLTTVYLGFGVLTANARWRYRSGGEQQGSCVGSPFPIAPDGRRPWFPIRSSAPLPRRPSSRSGPTWKKPRRGTPAIPSFASARATSPSRRSCPE